MSVTYYNSSQPSVSYSPEISDASSFAIGSDASSVMNIEQTIAKSQRIIQESIELSKKNQERKTHISDRVKACLPSAERLHKTDIVPRSPSVQAQAVELPTRRTDFTARSASRRTSVERSPLLENSPNVEELTFDDNFFAKGGDSSQQLEVNGLRSQVSELKLKLMRQEQTALSLQAEHHEQTGHRGSFNDVIETQQREIERLRDEVTRSQLELSRAQQKLQDQKHYVQSLEEEIENSREPDTHAIKNSREYRALYEQYVQALQQGRSRDSRVHFVAQDFRGQDDLGSCSDPLVGKKPGEKRLVGKIDDIEAKLSMLEDRYTHQTHENAELKKRLISLLEQTDQGRTADYKNYSVKLDSQSTFPHLSEFESIDELPPRPHHKADDSSKTHKVKVKKNPKKVKGRREVSADRSRHSKLQCCGKKCANSSK
jgi:archaellum component FlaC